MGNNFGKGIQWVFFRYQVTILGNKFTPILNSITYEPFESILGVGILFLVVSYILLFYRMKGSIKKAGLLTVIGGMLILCSCIVQYDILFSGPEGVSIPVGIPLILVLGFLMYLRSPDDFDTSSCKKEQPGSENFTNINSISTKNNSTTADSNQVITPDYYISLIVLNFVANFIFLPYYGLVGDDWTQLFQNNSFGGMTLSQLIFESHRPFLYIILKTLPIIFGYNPVIFYLINFIITSILLLIVFILIKSLLREIKIYSISYSFLITILFCVIFNKGELYAWSSIIPNNIAFALYLSSFYFYLNSDKKPFFILLSVISLSFALFTYELGIILPLIYILYAFCFKKSIKKSLCFFIPIVFYCIVRFTNWFGHGLVLNYGNGITPLSFLSAFSVSRVVYIPANFGLLIDSFSENVNYGIIGWNSLPPVIPIYLIILDIIVAFAIIWTLHKHIKKDPDLLDFKESSLILVGFAGIVISFVLISLNGFIANRTMVFIDFFGCLIIGLIVMKCVGKKIIVCGLFFIILFCLIINQGLYFNYVVSSNIQHDFNEAILKNAENISHVDVVYVNVTDLQVVNSNYMNAVGLDSWSIVSMMYNAGINTSNVTLIYNTYDKDPREYDQIGNRSYFEINRSNVDLSKIFFI